MVSPEFPGMTWERIAPGEVGFDPEGLRAAEHELERLEVDDDPRRGSFSEENAYRVVVVRHGRIVAEWNRGIDPTARQAGRIASATKSVFSSILGIAIDEGMIESADERMEDRFPAALDVLPGEGPKEGRHARAKDRRITLRQLVANTSGYLKPDEEPGEVKHYQTFGMNVLTHAIASAYNLYDPDRPADSPGFRLLIDTRLRVPIRGTWDYYTMNFDHSDGAKVECFGNFTGINATARDMARLGWLWCNYGWWDGEQIVPEEWMREAVRPVPAAYEADPDRNMIDTYGLGFWTNATGSLWPSLPEDSFAALGAGGNVIWVCPSLDLVVVEGPGPVYRDEMGDRLFPTILAALETP